MKLFKLPAISLALAILCSTLSTTALNAQEKTDDTPQPMVFAHYMGCYFMPLEFYMSEIELAQRHGIDGFAINCGAWDSKYIGATERIYEAAKRLGTGFKLMVSGDAGGRQAHNAYDQIKRFNDHPNQFRYKDEPVLSSFGGRAGMWDSGNNGQGLKMLEKEGITVCEVPNLTHAKYAANFSAETIRNFFAADESLGGLFWFGPDAPVSDVLRNNATARRVTQALGKIYMAGVSPSYNSPNLRTHYGVEGYGTQWEGTVRDQPDWIEIVTWNDYNEDSNIMPYRWQGGWDKHYNDHDETYLDATAYYSAWYKTGKRPEIKQDKVYYAYRNRSHWLRRTWNTKKEEWTDVTLEKWPFDQMHDDVQDAIYVSTALTEPATLTVAIGGKSYTYEQPAGMTHVRVPFGGGVPQFTLKRDGKEVLDFAGRKRIITLETQTKKNSAKGYHLVNRTWTGAAAAGKVVRHLEAESGELLEGAEIVTLGKAKAVRNSANFGSGFQIPFKSGLDNATYCIRVRYSNPTDEEVRLTLMAENPYHKDIYPYYIPLFMPPTAEGEFKTISFFWTLSEETSWMRVEMMENTGHVQKDHPLLNDFGTPAIDWIELVKVEPTTLPEVKETVFPEMVEIPGGSFEMGSTNGDPDESPVHKVKVSPFAMSRYEITNEEFEQFKPDHARLRDGYSWRNREPVTYVSWIDGAEYCNWLSEKAGLKPAYSKAKIEIHGEEKNSWVVDMKANGFRMPTEAEWEYVASGRGEGRTYPWGNEEPKPGYHGHFADQNVLEPDPRMPSQYQAGAMVVGSYPEGASRDGVMDLAGNVVEWCSDWFKYYEKDSATNPIGATPSNYRSIRGSSWGYYGLPVRVSDREYNSYVYGGYVYIGLRVVLPEDGWKKLKRAK
jgi:formylglycine-generating enzyme required for sulfatase activity